MSAPGKSDPGAVGRLPPSAWVRRFLPAIAAGGMVLDLACGGGRHVRLLAAAGHPVGAVDRDGALLAGLAGIPGVTTTVADLEAGGWPYAGRRFAGVVVTNYLHRPLLPRLAASLEHGGVLIYETFMLGNERFGRPANPDFLLRPGELREWAASVGLAVEAFEEGYVDVPKPAMVQRLCARHG